MEEVSRGRYRSKEPVPIGGRWKTLVRLHRGGELMTVPVFLPADPEIGEAEISAVDRTQPFESETDYLLRETRPNDQLVANLMHALLAVVAVVVDRLVRRGVSGDRRHPRHRPAPERGRRTTREAREPGRVHAVALCPIAHNDVRGRNLGRKFNCMEYPARPSTAFVGGCRAVS